MFGQSINTLRKIGIPVGSSVLLLAGILILAIASPAPGNFAASSIRFAVIGDFGVAGQPEADVANLVKGWNPDFIITTGDNNYFSVDGGDILIGRRAVPALPAGATVSGSTSATIPLETGAGVYYVIGKADGEDVIIEDTEENNIAARTIKVGPDLSLSSLSVPDSAARGAKITVKDTIKNLGAGSVGPSETHFYLSADAKLDPKDRLLGRRVAPGLAPGKSSSGGISVSIPLDIAPATYYLIAKADGNDAIGELSEGNNIKSKSIQIKP